MQFRDLTPSKAERSSHALSTAARLAEQSQTWNTAAEFYEAAAEIWPTGSGRYKLLRKAERCRSLADVTTSPDEMEF